MEYVLIQEMSWRPLNIESFQHNLTEAIKQTKAVKEYALIMEMPIDNLKRNNLVTKCSFCPKSSFNKNGSLVSLRARFLFLLFNLLNSLNS